MTPRRPQGTTTVECCQRCLGPVRRAHVVTDVLVFLDAVPRREGSYYYEGVDGLILEDRDGIVREPKYLRHRCDTTRERL